MRFNPKIRGLILNQRIFLWEWIWLLKIGDELKRGAEPRNKKNIAISWCKKLSSLKYDGLVMKSQFELVVFTEMILTWWAKLAGIQARSLFFLVHAPLPLGDNIIPAFLFEIFIFSLIKYICPFFETFFYY